MDRFLRWMHQLQDRKGKLTGSIALWLTDQDKSYTLLLSPEGVEVKEPGLRTADLVLSMKPAFFDAWIDGTLDLASMATGDVAWDGDVQLFRELGFRMSHAPMLPHQTLMHSHSQE